MQQEVAGCGNDWRRSITRRKPRRRERPKQNEAQDSPRLPQSRQKVKGKLLRQKRNRPRRKRDEAQQRARGSREQEAARIRKEREEELNRLQEALQKIAETRRTAMGLVMNLDSNAIQFEFNKAVLLSMNRELLSRIAGILLTSKGYSIKVHGHTDDVGSDAYNQELSERRAQAVRDYLVEAGISPTIVTTKGYGKSKPLVTAKTSEARAKNRRVEVEIVDTILNFNPPK